MSSREQRFLTDAKRFLALTHVLAGKIVKLRARHRSLEFLAGDDFAEKRIGRQQHVVIEENVVDAHDTFLTKHDVRLLGVAAMHRQPQPEVCIVVEIRAGRNDPVDESSLNQRNQR